MGLETFRQRMLCFNGATSFQTWRLRVILTMRHRSTCFNGATSFQTWRHIRARDSNQSDELLQWGHVFSDVETLPKMRPTETRWGFNGATSFQTWRRPTETRTPTSRTRASMGPRLFRRGDTLCPVRGGPLDELQWGHVFSDVETRVNTERPAP